MKVTNCKTTRRRTRLHTALRFACFSLHTGLSAAGELGRYIPLNADLFLCKRLVTSDSAEEKNNVINFYILKAGGREGQTIFRMPDAEKRKNIRFLFQCLDVYDAFQSGKL